MTIQQLLDNMKCMSSGVQVRHGNGKVMDVIQWVEYIKGYITHDCLIDIDLKSHETRIHLREKDSEYPDNQANDIIQPYPFATLFIRPHNWMKKRVQEED